MKCVYFTILIGIAMLGSCAQRITSSTVEATSLLGQPLERPLLSDARREAMESQLAKARLEWEAQPASESAIIWHGRRLAYLGRYREAIAIFENGLAIHPESVRLRRHLGHRLVTTRQLDRAIRVLEEAATLMRGQADEIEPDGAPNAAGIPRSTTQTNVWYHLGLARFLKGSFESALEAYEQCLALSKNDDMWCATAHWQWMTLMRLGQSDEAAALLERVRTDMEILENDSYHALLVLYKSGRRPEEFERPTSFDSAASDSAFAFGIANWYIVKDEVEAGLQDCREIISRGEWAAFGHLAAEAELARVAD